MCPEAEAGPNLCRIATGTYTGDGVGDAACTTGQAIVGLGFRPRLVWIEYFPDGDNLLVHAHLKFDRHPTTYCLYETHNVHHTRIDCICSLDVDGFTVSDGGIGTHPNAVGVTYIWWALG